MSKYRSFLDPPETEEAEEINASADQIGPPPYYSSPSYPANVFSTYNANTSSNQNLPPFSPPNGLTGVKVIPLDIISAISPNLPDSSDIPSAPTVEEINEKTGLKRHEREELQRAFSTMQNNMEWRTNEEETRFSVAQKKIQRILNAAKTRLTVSEKLEIEMELQDIYRLGQVWMREELERRRMIEHSNNLRKIKQKLRNDSIRNTIVMKVLGVMTSLLALIFINASYEHIPESFHSFVTYALNLTLIYLFLYIVFFIFYKSEVKRRGIVIDCIFCLAISIGYFGFSIISLGTEMKFVGFLGAASYFAEMCIKVKGLHEEKTFLRNYSSGVEPSISSVSQPGDDHNPIYTTMKEILDILD